MLVKGGPSHSVGRNLLSEPFYEDAMSCKRFPRDRWIPLTNGQLCRATLFPLMLLPETMMILLSNGLLKTIFCGIKYTNFLSRKPCIGKRRAFYLLVQSCSKIMLNVPLLILFERDSISRQHTD